MTETKVVSIFVNKYHNMDLLKVTQTLAGIFPVLPTPFDESGAVDAGAMADLVRFAVEAGVSGVVFPGFASEVEHLTSEERETLLREVVTAVSGNVLIIAGASAEKVEEVVAHGLVAQELDIEFLMIQPPKSIGSDAASVTKFLTEIAAQLPGMQIILQNAPAPRGSDLSPETIIKVASAVPQVTYVKEETLPAGPAITAILEAGPKTLVGVIGGGGARYVLDEYERGACAAMPALEIADQHVALDQAWRRGDRATARRIYVQTLPLLTLQAVFRMRLTKHALMRRGIVSNSVVRAPTAPLDLISIADIDANLVEIGVLDDKPDLQEASA